MKTIKKLPVGIENFAKIRTEGFYYIDKTGLIRELLNNWGEVNLFTRPRRFGKSLNMNMLKCFFEYDCDVTLFDGLEITGDAELCKKYMGKFPVISISLKDVNGENFEAARSQICSVIGNEAMRFQFLQESGELTKDEKKLYRQLIRVDETVVDKDSAAFMMSDAVLTGGLRTLSVLLKKHYDHKVIILIDEYDVPLDKAQQFQYYDKMIMLLQNLFSQSLKSNDNLYFAILTGCLRVSKESIFTGLNNLKIRSITDVQYDEYFGFSSEEVKKILDYYGFGAKYEAAKEWYDGYRFGNADIYCPWDIISYVDLMRSEPDAEPRAFWINTSSNDIIRRFIEKATKKTRREIEQLIEGESIRKKINQELTYRELYKNIENFWSVLFTTGYLTRCGRSDGEFYQLAIPNHEIRKIFINQILEWFQEEVRKDIPQLDAFCAAFPKADAEAIEEQFNAYLSKTISIRDTSVRKDKKENFYHGILLGLLSHREDWEIDSNAESGEGFSDILIEIDERNIGIVIEVKYPDSGNLDAGCIEALKQIEALGYETKLRQDGMTTIIKYGIACNKKHCRVMLGQ